MNPIIIHSLVRLHLVGWLVWGSLSFLGAGAVWADPVRGQIRDSRDVAPGIRFYRERFADGPRIYHVLEIDLRRSEYGLEVVSGVMDRTSEGETPLRSVPEIADRMLAGGASAQAVLNGDQWLASDCVPMGTMVRQGHPLRLRPGRPALALGRANQVGVSAGALDILFKSGETVTTLSVFNRAPTEASGPALIGDQSVANAMAQRNGVAVYRLDAADSTAGVNRWIAGVLTPWKGTPAADTEEAATFFIAGRGPWAQTLQQSSGRKNRVAVGVFFPGIEGTVDSVVGGWPVLISEGRSVLDSIPSRTSDDISPRTAVGVNRATGTMWWVVVDGRRPGYSLGESLDRLADWFVAVGATEAINLDGGGSSTLWVRGETVNHPSDLKGARGVVNALALIAKI